MTASRSLRRALRVAVAVLVVVMVLPSTASAHADLISTDPVDGAVLDEAPTRVTLSFSEPVDPIEPAVRVVDADGNEVASAVGDQADGSDTLAIDLAGVDLADGTYVVAWQAVSTDSHNIRGAFTFSVGEASDTRFGLYDDLFDGAGSQTASSGVLGIGRFASFLGAAVLTGALFAHISMLRRHASPRRTVFVIRAAAATAIVGTVLMIATQATIVGSGPFDWGAVAATTSGQWWVLRLAALVIAAAATITVGSTASPVRRAVVVSVASAGLMVVVAAGGHAVTGRAVPVGFAMTVVHLVAISAWVGGLVLLIVAVERHRLVDAARRFSPWALGSVAVLAVSGSVNGWRQLGSVGDVTSSAYGRWLVVKLAVVAVVIVAAAVARRSLRRSTTANDAVPLAPALSAASRHDHNAERHIGLRRVLAVEVIGMGLVFAATAGLVGAAPPDLEQAENTFSTTLVGDRIAQVELEPARTGGTTMHVTITSPGGAFDRADEITVSIESRSAELGPLDIETVTVSPNHVIADDAVFPVPGDWTVQIVARYGEFDRVVFDVDVDILR